MYKKIFFSLFLLFNVTLFAPIATHKSMSALVDYIKEEKYEAQDIIVIFDIDNTLAHPKTEVGSDQWLEYHAKQQAVNGISIAQAYENLLPLYYKIQHIIDLDLVEDMIPQLIAQLKNAGICTIGLTARYHPIVDRTLTQLATLGISFSNLCDQEMAIDGSIKQALYKNGIIFCSSNNKGEILFNFLKMMNLRPKKIYCIDDKMHHLLKVEKVALENGVDCTCIHYTRCQDRVENFNPAQAEKELLALNLCQEVY